MIRTYRLGAIALAGLLGASAVACGLLDDATTVTIGSGERTFTLNADLLGVAGIGGTVPAVPCSPEGDQCGATNLQGELVCEEENLDCQLRCGAVNLCEAAIEVVVSETIDISARVRDRTSAKALSEVTVDRLAYAVQANTLNIDLPELTLYVGPAAANTLGDAGVVRLGQMPAILAGQRPSGEVQMEAPGREALANFLRAFEEPFRIFLEGQLTVEANDSFPAGQMTLAVEAFFQTELL